MDKNWYSDVQCDDEKIYNRLAEWENDYGDIKVICKSDGEIAYCNALAVNGLCKCDDRLCENVVAVIVTDKNGYTRYLALED